MEYRTRLHLLGLPLIQVSIGPAPGGGNARGVARGWVAVGDIAFGVLLSVGGFAAGGVAVGGMAVGALALGGLAVGGLSLGGLALGALSFGGAAFGWRAAQGGLAVARDFAEGGGAAAVHANDDLAASYFAAHPFFSISRWVARFSFVLLVLPLVAGLLMRRRTRRSD